MTTRAGHNVTTDGPPRAGSAELACRIWPAGRALPTTGLCGALKVNGVVVKMSVGCDICCSYDQFSAVKWLSVHRVWFSAKGSE